MSPNIRGLIVFGTIIVFVATCTYLVTPHYDCIRMTADGSVHCSCEFRSKDEWIKFKDNTVGLNHDGWETVVFPSFPANYDPCKAVKEDTKADSSLATNEPYSSEATPTPMPQQSTIAQDSIPINKEEPIKKNKVQNIDSVPLFREPERGEKWLAYVTNKLPQSYCSGIFKYTFYREDTTLMVKCYTNGELHNTFVLKQNNYVLDIVGGDSFFNFDNGLLTLVTPDKHVYHPLYQCK